MESCSLLSDMLLDRVPADGHASSQDLPVTAAETGKMATEESAFDRDTPSGTPTCGEFNTANSSETRQAEQEEVSEAAIAAQPETDLDKPEDCQRVMAAAVQSAALVVEPAEGAVSVDVLAEQQCIDDKLPLVSFVVSPLLNIDTADVARWLANAALLDQRDRAEGSRQKSQPS